MSSSALSSIFIFLLVTLLLAHLLGTLFVRLRQPRVIGEILAGIALGPSLLRLHAPAADAVATRAGLEFVYWIGLLLLMFLSGAETRKLFRREDSHAVAWLALLGTGAPFAALLLMAWALPLKSLMGTANSYAALVMVLGIAVAVTSIPVISRIFHDLGILKTRFARIVLSVAVFEDVALWGVLAVATALAKSVAVSKKSIVLEVAAALVYFGLGLTVFPRVIEWLRASRWNEIARRTPVAWQIIVMFGYVSVAAALHVNLVFAAFLAGISVPSGRAETDEAVHSLHAVSYAVFIPVYFALVGYKLDLGHTFSLRMLAIFLAGACGLKLAAVWLAAWGAKFSPLSRINLAIATNARGGPGIVLASVALDAGIISAPFYTTLILTAVVTSQAAGFWLEYVMRKGLPLLGEEPAEAAAAQQLAT